MTQGFRGTETKRKYKQEEELKQEKMACEIQTPSVSRSKNNMMQSFHRRNKLSSVKTHKTKPHQWCGSTSNPTILQKKILTVSASYSENPDKTVVKHASNVPSKDNWKIPYQVGLNLKATFTYSYKMSLILDVALKLLLCLQK